MTGISLDKPAVCNSGFSQYVVNFTETLPQGEKI